MMTLRAAAFLVAFLVALLLASSTSALPKPKQDQPPDSKVTLAIETGRAELPVDVASTVLRYPLQRLDKTPSRVPSLSLVSVRTAGTLRPELQAAFSKAEVSSDFSSVVLTVATSTLQFANTYELTLQVTPEDLEQLAPSRLVLELTVPQASLRSVDKLVVERVWGLHEWEVTRTPLVVDEASGKLPLTGLSFRLGRSTFEGDQVTAGVALNDAKLPDVVRGKPTELEYSFTGHPSFGTVSGSFELASPQLGAPLTVPFEIRTRLCRGYILLIVALGVAFSWLLKYHLQNQIVLAQARVDGARVADRLRPELAGRTDQSFAEAQQALDALGAALQGKDAPAIAAAANDLEGKLSAALVTFNQKKADAQARLDQLRALVEPPWTLPQTLLDVLRDAATTTLTTAQKELDAGNAAGALDVVKDAEHQLAEKLEGAAKQWRKAVLEAGSTLTTYEVGLSKKVQDAFAARFSALQPMLDGAELNQPNALLPQLLEFLPALCAIYNRASECFWQLGQLMTLEMRSIRQGFAGVALRNQAAFDGLVQVADQTSLEASRQAVLPAPPAGLIKRLDDLKIAWQSGLGGQVDVAAVVGVAAKLAERDYLEAARIALQVLQKAPENRALGAREVKAAALVVAERAAPATMMVIRSERQAPERPTYEILERESARQIGIAQLIQTLFAGAIAAAVGYATYQKNFVGNWSDALTIFLWAFGLDLSMDALLKLKPGGKANEA